MDQMDESNDMPLPPSFPRRVHIVHSVHIVHPVHEPRPPFPAAASRTTIAYDGLIHGSACPASTFSSQFLPQSQVVTRISARDFRPACSLRCIMTNCNIQRGETYVFGKR
jgi:hypothetical protein